MINKFLFAISMTLGLAFADKIDELIETDVENGFAGAVIVVIKDGEVVKRSAYGYKNTFKDNCTTGEQYEILPGCDLDDTEREKMELDTVFDLASLTKVYSTTFAMMKLTYEGKLDIDKKVIDYIDFPEEHSDITVKDLAQHTAGFVAEIPFYNNLIEDDYFSQNRNKTIDLLTGQNKTGDNPDLLYPEKEYDPRTKNRYSDIDFMLLTVIIEKITGKRIDEYVEEEIYSPLGVNLKYKPLDKGVDINKIAQTAVGNWSTYEETKIKIPYIGMRETSIKGNPHDENAYYSMDSVSGHAGLFGSAKDLEILVKLMLNGGKYKNVTLFDQTTINKFLEPSKTNLTYGSGWRLAGSKGSMSPIMGEHASNKAYGHTGFTRMNSMIDPKYNFAVILLTNGLQSRQLSKATFESDEYKTPKYKDVMTLAQEEFLDL